MEGWGRNDRWTQAGSGSGVAKRLGENNTVLHQDTTSQTSTKRDT